MTIEKAIEKAIEGGYVYKDLVGQMTFSQDIRENPFGRQQLWCTPDIDSGYWAIEEIIFLDPLFWKSLGKAMGWKKELRIYYEGFCKDEECNTDGRIDEAWRIEEWEYLWHRFIDKLADGGTAEQFFDEL